jgi:hypothetical protein
MPPLGTLKESFKACQGPDPEPDHLCKNVRNGVWLDGFIRSRDAVSGRIHSLRFALLYLATHQLTSVFFTSKHTQSTNVDTINQSYPLPSHLLTLLPE